MGILNITPDSFSDGGLYNSTEQAVMRAKQLIIDGADILDIGGESTRPGASQISVNDELSRVIPVINEIRNEHKEILISVDTYKSEVAKQSIVAGANIINDISGLVFDKKMASIAATLDVPVILMHLKGTPQTMQSLANYKDLVPEVLSYFSEKISQLKALGANQLIIDPGFGFAKTLEHNYELLNRFQELHSLGCPLLAGVSRKSMIYKALDSTPAEALNGTTVLHTIAVQKGAHILRVHDVKPAVEAIKLVAKLQAN